jgi:hypothetical protein
MRRGEMENDPADAGGSQKAAADARTLAIAA